MTSSAPRPSRIWSLVPWLLFLGLVVVKVVLIVRAAHFPSGSDELLYFDMARSLASGKLYADAQYPPLFPASIVPAIMLHRSYKLAVLLMAVYSSALVFPVWLIGRDMLDERHAAVVAALSALLPFHYTIPRVVMSENLYYPLIIGCAYLVLTTRWRRLALRDALTGALIAVTFLTRFMTLVFVPALAIAWLLRERAERGTWMPSRNVFIRAALLTGVALLVIAPWVYSEMRNGFTFVQTVGVDAGIGGGRVPAEAKTTVRLLKFAAEYVASWTLWLAPLLGLLVLALARLRRLRWDALDRLTVLTTAMAALLLPIAARHAWKAIYNWPMPLRVLDRYCIYLVALGLLIAYGSAVAAVRDRRLGRWAHAAATIALPIAALGVAWWARFLWGFLPAPTLGAPGIAASDTYHLFMMGIWFWPIAVGGLAILGWLAWKHDRRLPAVAALVAAAFFVVGAPRYIALTSGTSPLDAHAAVLGPAIRRGFPGRHRIRVAVSHAVIRDSGRTTRSFGGGLKVKLEWAARKSLGVGALGSPEAHDPNVEVFRADEMTGTPSGAHGYTVDGVRYVYVVH